MKSKQALKLVPNIDQKKPRLGSYYIKPHKSGWSLYHQSYDGNNKKTQKRVETLAYKDLGFRPDMPLEEAKDRCRRLNRENGLDKRTIRESARQLTTIESINETLFPKKYVDGFQELLTRENQGSEEHLRKLFSHFEFIQRMINDLKILAHEYKDNEKSIYTYMVRNKVSVNYSQRLISLLNRYAKYVCKKEGRYFEEVAQVRGISRERLNDAHEDKKGIRRESRPIGPDLLKNKKEKLSEENYNWLFISIWFGLRPSDFKGLAKHTVEFNSDGQAYLAVYQSKLTSLPKPKRFKYIPILFKEQETALEIIKSKNYKAPIYKIMKKVFGEGFGLYAGRKNFTDMMLNHGYQLEDISLWLGHTSIETTWTHYKEKNSVNLPTPKKIKKD